MCPSKLSDNRLKICETANVAFIGGRTLREGTLPSLTISDRAMRRVFLAPDSGEFKRLLVRGDEERGRRGRFERRKSVVGVVETTQRVVANKRTRRNRGNVRKSFQRRTWLNFAKIRFGILGRDEREALSCTRRILHDSVATSLI